MESMVDRVRDVLSECVLHSTTIIYGCSTISSLFKISYGQGMRNMEILECYCK